MNKCLVAIDMISTRWEGELELGRMMGVWRRLEEKPRGGYELGVYVRS